MVSIFLNISQTQPQGTALSLKTRPPSSVNCYKETVITNGQILQAKNRGRVEVSKDVFVTVYPSYRNAPPEEKLPIHSLLTLIVPAATLLSAFVAFRVSDAHGWDAVFPSPETCPIVLKTTIWVTLIAVVAYEHSYYHYSGSGKNLAIEGPWSRNCVGVEVIIDDGYLAAQPVEQDAVILEQMSMDVSLPLMGMANQEEDINVHGCMEDPSHDLLKEPHNCAHGGKDKIVKDSHRPSASPTKTEDPPDFTMSKQPPVNLDEEPEPSAKTNPPSPTSSAQSSVPGSIPFRFIRATKGDVAAAKQRWADTCAWRAENSMDTSLSEPHHHLKIIKENYPHYFHLRGKNGECCYYEQPPKMNLTELKKAGITLEKLIKHYAICCEYMWTKIEPSEEGKSIYVIDLDGMGIRDFAGEVVDFVKRASSFTGAHYPERSGTIYVINVPSWFSVIWNVVKPMVDDVTKKKIKILRYGKEGITKALMEKIDIENIPPEYGGTSMPLGQSPEEIEFI
eukprot:CAMPEP_0176483156 /NCGR_PEP_ID=MMETSP0200_2-20121128/3771_1 /TAXON_ID=947934 /ORGANISM="Chaetoceros sp., Strain GSL56" /LENGTH=506 /DNA_ID=CAMNT_0017879545 /DNA_START=95 /DNA_END=1612 /DNA_ORIENTATION=-